MIEYNKIETLWKRDLGGTKRLMPGVFNNPTVEFLKDNVWQFSEKIDGTNVQIAWDGHKISFGGRTADSSIPSHLVNKLNELFLTDEVDQMPLQYPLQKNEADSYH